MPINAAVLHNARVLRAVQGALAAGEVTAELGGTLDTAAATDAVLRRLS